MTTSALRFFLAAIVVGGAATFLQMHTRAEVFPARLPLSSFPRHLNGWNGSDIPLPKDILEVLGSGDFLLNTYRNQENPGVLVDLFIAYFPSQRTGDTLHSPQNCLPGAGWTPVESSRVMLRAPGHAPFPANRYIVAKGDSRRLVLYWYWAHNRGTAAEYWARYYLVSDSIRINRSDGALIRLTTPIYPTESSRSAEDRLVRMTADIVPLLSDYIPN